MKLREYLKTEGIKRRQFAEKIGVSLPTLDNVIAGYETFISIGYKIQKMTRGRVKMKDLLPTKYRKSRAKKRPPSNRDDT